MSKKSGLLGGGRWKLLLAALVGGIVAAAAGDLRSWLLAERPDPWVAECRAMLAEEQEADLDRSIAFGGGLCVAFANPSLPDRELASDDGPLDHVDAFWAVRDAHRAALLASPGGEVRVRFRVDADGAPVDAEVWETTGSDAVEAFALDLAATMTFAAVAGDEDPAPATWAEFPVAVGVRPGS